MKSCVWVGAWLAALLVAPSGCRSKRAPESERVVVRAPPPPPPTQVEEEAPPVDQVLPDELAEGKEQAFGLTLPRLVRVTMRFDDVVFATTSAQADKVANYVRRRVIADRVETGPTKTVFAGATVRGHPGPLLAVEVISRRGVTELQVRDVTPKPATPGLSQKDRWRAVGLNPDGTLIDPTRLGTEPR